jgi:hypothetical protein
VTAAVPAPGSRRPILLLVLLGLAVLLGLVAVFLSGAAPAAPPTRAGQLVVDLPPAVWGILYLSPLFVGLAAVLLQRLRQGRAAIDRSTLVSLAVMLAVAVLFLYLVSATAPAGTGGTISVTGSTPPTNTSQTPPHNSTPPPNGTTVPTSDTVTISTPVLLLVALAVCAGVGLLAVPGVLSRLIDRGRGPRALPEVRPGIERALAEAGAAIDGGADLRETIVRLYVRLLLELAPRVGDVAYLTPDEIRRQVLAGLGVTPTASEALTRLFEEARYSTHPIGPGDAGRFREAIGQVQADLRRGAAS